MLNLTMHDGSCLELKEAPKKIVSLVPSVTEMLFDLNITPVGRTAYCIEPKMQVRSIVNVGKTKNINLDRVDDIAPDLIIANQEENSKSDIDSLSKKYKIWVTYPKTVGETIDMLTQTAQLSKGCEEKVEVLKREVLHSSIQAKKILAGVLIWKNPWMAVGADTYMNDVLSVCGFQNVYLDLPSRYPTLHQKDLLKSKVLFLPSEPYAFKQKDEHELLEFFKDNGQSVNVFRVHGPDMTWPGFRLKNIIQTLNDIHDRLIHT